LESARNSGQEAEMRIKSEGKSSVVRGRAVKEELVPIKEEVPMSFTDQ